MCAELIGRHRVACVDAQLNVCVYTSVFRFDDVSMGALAVVVSAD